MRSSTNDSVCMNFWQLIPQSNSGRSSFRKLSKPKLYKLMEWRSLVTIKRCRMWLRNCNFFFLRISSFSSDMGCSWSTLLITNSMGTSALSELSKSIKAKSTKKDREVVETTLEQLTKKQSYNNSERIQLQE